MRPIVEVGDPPTKSTTQVASRGRANHTVSHPSLRSANPNVTLCHLPSLTQQFSSRCLRSPIQPSPSYRLVAQRDVLGSDELPRMFIHSVMTRLLEATISCPLRSSARFFGPRRSIFDFLFLSLTGRGTKGIASNAMPRWQPVEGTITAPWKSQWDIPLARHSVWYVCAIL